MALEDVTDRGHGRAAQHRTQRHAVGHAGRVPPYPASRGGAALSTWVSVIGINGAAGYRPYSGVEGSGAGGWGAWPHGSGPSTASSSTACARRQQDTASGPRRSRPPGGLRAACTRTIPMGHDGDAEADIAPVVAFLLSDACRYMTGADTARRRRRLPAALTIRSFSASRDTRLAAVHSLASNSLAPLGSSPHRFGQLVAICNVSVPFRNLLDPGLGTGDYGRRRRARRAHRGGAGVAALVHRVIDTSWPATRRATRRPCTAPAGGARTGRTGTSASRSRA